MSKKTKIILLLVAVFIAVVVLYDFSSDKALEKEIITSYAISDPQFLRSIESLLGPPIRSGNFTDTLVNGDEFFPAMLDAIGQAEKTITMETYIYWSGKVGQLFTTALSKKAHEGVRVNLLIDSVGSSKLDKKLFQEMEKNGVHLVRYNPTHWYTIHKLNNRTHRKILIVDGKVGFTGGAGIADIWLGNAKTKDNWRDTHFSVAGPAVAQMQAVFADNWMETTGEALQGSEYFPPLPELGMERAQAFGSSPREGTEKTRLLYLLSIAAARKTIYMSNAYFVPDDLSVQHLISAAKRGVKIQIIAPGEITDTKVVRQASRSRWGELLEAGVEFYEYQPTMFHCKVFVADGIWSTVGSTNFDNRSFRLNDEMNLNIFDTVFAREQIKIFQQDLAKSRKVTLQEWKDRPFSEKFTEWAAGLLKHQM